MNFIILSHKDKPFDKVAVRKHDIDQVVEIAGDVMIILYNNDRIKIAETFSEVLEQLNRED